MQGPVQPRGTGFAEQAAIQYFVFSSLFNVWPQAKPCSEYRTGAFLTGSLTGSLRAVAGQFTSTFIVMHPYFPNWKLRNRETRIAPSCPSEHFHEDPQGLCFLGHFACSKHKLCWWPPWLCTTSIPTVQIPGSYLGKDQCEQQFGVFHNKLAWKGLADWTLGSWQQPRVKQVLQSVFIASFVCLLTPVTSEQKSYRNHFLLFPAHS